MCYQMQYQYLNEATISNQYIALINCRNLEHVCLNNFLSTFVMLLNFLFDSFEFSFNFWNFWHHISKYSFFDKCKICCRITSWRRLGRGKIVTMKTSSNVLKTSLEYVLNTCLEDALETNKIFTGYICIQQI